MKLYIWEGDGVLADYTTGMVCALGSDLETALLAVKDECPWAMQSFPAEAPTRVVDLGECSKTIPLTAAVCLGGG